MEESPIPPPLRTPAGLTDLTAYMHPSSRLRQALTLPKDPAPRNCTSWKSERYRPRFGSRIRLLPSFASLWCSSSSSFCQSFELADRGGVLRLLPLVVVSASNASFRATSVGLIPSSKSSNLGIAAVATADLALVDRMGFNLDLALFFGCTNNGSPISPVGKVGGPSKVSQS